MKRLAYFMTLQLFSVSIFSLELVTHEEINFFPKPIIVLPEGINSIAWSENDYFAVGERSEVCFSISEEIGDQLISSPGGDVKFLKFVKNPDNGNDQLLVFTENNVLGVKVFSSMSPNYLMTKKYNPELKINAIDFSPKGDRILAGFDNSHVKLMTPLYILQEIEEVTLRDHEAGVFSVAFSPDSRYFLSAGRDGNINIWSRDNETEKLFTIKLKTKLEYPVCFSPDSRFVVSVLTKKEIIFRDFAGNEIQRITTEKPIKKYSMSTNSKHLFVLSDNNIIYIYDIDTGKAVGFIPSFNKTPVTQFGFNKDESRLIVGHEDGSVYYLKSEEVILRPGAKAPKLGAGGTSGKGFSGTGRNKHSIEIRAAGNVYSKPYFQYGFSASVGYTNAQIISPFYFGILVTPELAFPNVNFPYSYYQNAQQLPNPNMIKLTAAVPFGVAVFPKNDIFEFFAEVQGGFALHTLYSSVHFNGKLYYSGIVGVILGVAIKRITLYIGGVYDFGFGLSGSVGIGYRIKVGKE